MDTGRILNFSEAEMAEWKALFAFWEAHPTPESLPASPHTIRMEDGRSYTMCGPPSWKELWRVCQMNFGPGPSVPRILSDPRLLQPS